MCFFSQDEVEKRMAEEHNEEKAFLALLFLLHTIQGNSAFPINDHVSHFEYVTLQVRKHFWMGLFCLNQTCWKNLLLLSTAAVCSCICILKIQFLQVTDCLMPLSPCLFLYLADPFARISHSKSPGGLSSQIYYVLIW